MHARSSRPPCRRAQVSSRLGDAPATPRALTALRVSDYRLILRRLSLRDDSYIRALLAEGNDDARCPDLSASAHALVRLGALIAVDAAPTSYMSAIEDARRAGLTTDQIVTTLIAVLPVVGEPRVVSAAPNLSLALGYDVADALEGNHY
jgi:alkylhydroperoxidase/carboxymuconolactone decarboxylase family protein YurZ